MDLGKARIKSEITPEEREAIAVKSEEFAKSRPKTIEDLTAVYSAFASAYEKLKEQVSDYEHKAEILGIPFSMSLEKTRIEDGLANISFNIAEIKRQIEEKGANPFETSKDAISAANFTAYYGVKAETAKGVALGLYDIDNQYSNEARLELEKGVDGRVQDIIKRTKLRLIARKRKELKGQKRTWFSRIRGLDKLRDIELKNLDLEEQLIQDTPIEAKTSYSIIESLAELKAFSDKELGKQNTQEMDDLLTTAGEVFRVDERALTARVNQKVNSSLMVLDPKRRVSTATKIHRAEEKREGLNEAIQDLNKSIQERKKDENENEGQKPKKEKALTRFENAVALAVHNLDVDVPEDRRRDVDERVSLANRITAPINTEAVRQAIRRDEHPSDGFEH